MGCKGSEVRVFSPRHSKSFHQSGGAVASVSRHLCREGRKFENLSPRQKKIRVSIIDGTLWISEILLLCILFIYLNQKAQVAYILDKLMILKRDVKDHNLGVSLYTKGKGPWKHIYLKDFPTRIGSISIGKEIKISGNPKRIRAIIKTAAVG